MWSIRACTHCTLKYDKWWLILRIHFIEMQLLKRRLHTGASEATAAKLKHIFLGAMTKKKLAKCDGRKRNKLHESPTLQQHPQAIKLTRFKIQEACAGWLASSILEWLLIPINKFMHNVGASCCRDFSTMMC